MLLWNSSGYECRRHQKSSLLSCLGNRGPGHKPSTAPRQKGQLRPCLRPKHVLGGTDLGLREQFRDRLGTLVNQRSRNDLQLNRTIEQKHGISLAASAFSRLSHTLLRRQRPMSPAAARDQGTDDDVARLLRNRLRVGWL